MTLNFRRRPAGVVRHTTPHSERESGVPADRCSQARSRPQLARALATFNAVIGNRHAQGVQQRRHRVDGLDESCVAVTARDIGLG